MILQRGGALRIFSDLYEISLLLMYFCGGSFWCPFVGIVLVISEGGSSSCCPFVGIIPGGGGYKYTFGNINAIVYMD